MPTKVTDETVGSYLRENDLVPAEALIDVQPLGGGVSNVVLRVQYDDEALVVKQPLDNLAVDDHWPADVSRVHNEAAAARTYGDVLRESSLENVSVPTVRFESSEDHVIVISCAPPSTTTWKAELLAGRVDHEVAKLAGQFLGMAHGETAANGSLREAFGTRPFEQLRVDPYHLTTANRHPEVEAEILDEVNRLRRTRRTLVHGDYSPKNVLVDQSGDEPNMWILDFEVAHWGDPAFDVAFMLNHLYIKSVYSRPTSKPYFEAARTFWQAYNERTAWSIERDVVRELGVLLLARVDGKSPVEYVQTERTAALLRTIAKTTLTTDVETLDAFEAILIEEIANNE